MNNETQFILYHLPQEEGKVQVVIKDETIWATQKAMSQLFDVGIPDISKRLKKIFETGELKKDMVVSKMEITTPNGAIQKKKPMQKPKGSMPYSTRHNPLFQISKKKSND